jgi:hypothetical protein
MKDQEIHIGHRAGEFLDKHMNDQAPRFQPRGRYQVEIFLAKDFLEEESRFIKKIEGMLGSAKRWAPYIQLAPRIREHLQVSDFRKLDLWRVVIPQASFMDDDKFLQALSAHCFPNNQAVWLRTDTLSPNRQASDHCAFACIIPLD